MTGLFAFIFTIGGILGFLSMVFHGVYSAEDKFAPLFIFAGGTLLAFLLELTLVHIFSAYDYTNLPLTILEIPLVIPLGWVVSFYGLLHISHDIIRMIYNTEENLLSKSENKILSITSLTGSLAILFGLSIEVLARNSEFWVFHFTSVAIFGVPIIVSLAWGMSVAVFTAGVLFFYKYRSYWWLILMFVHVANSMIAFVLLQFVEITA